MINLRACLIISSSFCLFLSSCQGEKVQSPAKENAALCDFSQQLNILAPPQTMRAGDEVIMLVVVKNITGETWPGGMSDKSVRLYYQWLCGDLREKENYAYRKYLPEEGLCPGKSEVLEVAVKVPNQTGNAILMFSMVQEDVRSFDENGSLSIPVLITKR